MMPNILSNSLSTVYNYFFGVMSDPQLESVLERFNTSLALMENNERQALTPILNKMALENPEPLTSDENKALNKNFISLVNRLTDLKSLERQIDDYLKNAKIKNLDLLRRFAPYRTRLADLEKLKTDLILIIYQSNPIAHKTKIERINEVAVKPLRNLAAKILKASETMTGKKANVVALAMLGLYASSFMRPTTALCFATCAYVPEHVELKNNKAHQVVFASFLAYSASLLSLPSAVILAAASEGSASLIAKMKRI
jgi:hypothetical protein